MYALPNSGILVCDFAKTSIQFCQDRFMILLIPVHDFVDTGL